MHNKPSRIPPFVFGLILGILCTIYVPKYVQTYLPELIAGNDSVLKGTVIVKEKKGETLLLTLSTPEGALLATFKQKTGEIDLLIKEKDEVQFTVPKYTPFIDDPIIIRVVQQQQADTAPAEALAAPATPAGSSGKSTQGKKSRHLVKLQTAAQAPGGAMEVKPQAAASAPASEMEVKPPDQGNGAPPAGDKKTTQ
jgi:hypothetical protein